MNRARALLETVHCSLVPLPIEPWLSFMVEMAYHRRQVVSYDGVSGYLTSGVTASGCCHFFSTADAREHLVPITAILLPRAACELFVESVKQLLHHLNEENDRAA